MCRDILKVGPARTFLVRLFSLGCIFLLGASTFFCQRELADQQALAISEVPFELANGFLIEFEVR
jgi:hypothetical protein